MLYVKYYVARTFINGNAEKVRYLRYSLLKFLSNHIFDRVQRLEWRFDEIIDQRCDTLLIYPYRKSLVARQKRDQSIEQSVAKRVEIVDVQHEHHNLGHCKRV